MNPDYDVVFGKNIRMLRKKAGLTQEMLAARFQLYGCDITRSALAKIEVGQRHVYPDEIKILKEILDVGYEELFVGGSFPGIDGQNK